MRIRPLILLLAVFFQFLIGYAQKPLDLDSLNKALRSDVHDTTKINILITLGEALFISNVDTVQILMEHILQLAKKNLPNGVPEDFDGIDALERKYLSALAEASNNLGYLYQQMAEYERALEYYLKGLQLDEALGNLDGVSAALNNIGGVYRFQAKIGKALEFYQRSLEINEGRNDIASLSHTYNNLGAIYNSQGNVIKALGYFHKCLNMLQELGNKYGIAMTMNNIAGIHMNQGNIGKGLEFLEKGMEMRKEIGDQRGISMSLTNIGYLYYHHGDPNCKEPKAECDSTAQSKGLELLRQSLEMEREMGNTEGIADGLSNLGTIYRDQGKYGTALDYLYQSLETREELGDVEGLHVSLTNIAATELKMGRNKDAREHAERSLGIARELRAPAKIKHSANVLKEISIKEKKYKEALEMYELYIKMRDSMNNENTQKETIRQQTKYEFEKAQLVKEQEDKDRSRIEREATARRDNLQYSVILIAILVLFGGVLALGFINVSERVAEGIIFFSFLIVFEFLLVLADPYIDRWSGGAPGMKLLFNAGIAALIFPMHAFFETKLEGRLVKK